MRRAAEVFADPKIKNEVSDDKGVKVNEKVAQKVDSNSKKPHRAAGELTLSERKCEAENTAENMEVSDENNWGKTVAQSEEVELSRKEMKYKRWSRR